MRDVFDSPSDLVVGGVLIKNETRFAVPRYALQEIREIPESDYQYILEAADQHFNLYSGRWGTFIIDNRAPVDGCVERVTPVGMHFSPWVRNVKFSDRAEELRGEREGEVFYLEDKPLFIPVVNRYSISAMLYDSQKAFLAEMRSKKIFVN